MDDVVYEYKENKNILIITKVLNWWICYWWTVLIWLLPGFHNYPYQALMYRMHGAEAEAPKRSSRTMTRKKSLSSMTPMMKSSLKQKIPTNKKTSPFEYGLVSYVFITETAYLLSTSSNDLIYLRSLPQYKSYESRDNGENYQQHLWYGGRWSARKAAHR